MNTKKIKPIFKKILLVLMVLQILAGLVWCIGNFGTFPPYGDTPEYILISYTFRLDIWRPIAYPLFLRGCIELTRGTPIPYFSLAFFFQMVASLLAIYYTLAVITRNYMGGGQNQKMLWFVSLFLLMNPLVLHFDMSIMTDSLCLTFSLMLIAEIIRILKGDGPLVRSVISGIVAFVLMSLFRAERLMLFGCLMILLVLVVALFMRKRPGYRKVIAGLMVVVLVALPLTNVIKKTTQTADIGRLTPSVHTALSQRLAWPLLARNYDALPEDLKAIITREDAQYHDESRLNTNTIAAKILKAAPDEYGHYLDVMSFTVLTHDTWQVLHFIVRDYVWNCLSPAVENIQTVYKATSINLTWERMSHATPTVARIFVILSELTFWTIMVMLAYLLYFDFSRFSRCKELLIMVVAYVLIQSVMYTMTSNYGFHIRYQLLNEAFQMLIFCAVAFFGQGEEPGGTIAEKDQELVKP